MDWVSDPLGGGVFTRQRDLILAHPPSCPSLLHAWQPRKGGVTCVSDLMDCHSCSVTFFWDGITTLFEDCPDSWWYFCRCRADRALACPCGGGCVREPVAAF